MRKFIPLWRVELEHRMELASWAKYSGSHWVISMEGGV
jgi:hypothetical protein